MRVSELENIGIGKKCLIIGGGMSVGEFDFERIQGMTIIVVNDSMYPYTKIKPDYLVYNDQEFVKKFKKMDLQGVKIICSMNYYYARENLEYYMYTLDDFSEKGYILKHECNTGLKALIIAKHIMCFDEVYLIGFDFHTRIVEGIERSHYIGDLIGQDEKYIDEQQVKDHFKRLPVMLEQFDVINKIEGIYNCYKDSKLTKFEYKLP